MDFASVGNGMKFHLIGKLMVFDHAHDAHLMQLSDGTLFHYTGLLEDGFESYTIFNACLLHQFPMPRVGAVESTIVLTHSKPNWDSIFSLVDLCSGFGGLSQGAIAAGWNIAVAVDHNPKMTGLYSKICNAPTVCGDFGEIHVLHEIWKNSKGARAVSSGFSCQPFSRLGDGKSQADDRSNCLPKTLAAAFYLQAWVVVLECVSPAGSDAYVRSELDKFVQATNSHVHRST